MNSQSWRLSNRTPKQLEFDHVVFPGLIMYAASLVSLFEIDSDRRTARQGFRPKTTFFKRYPLTLSVCSSFRCADTTQSERVGSDILQWFESRIESGNRRQNMRCTNHQYMTKIFQFLQKKLGMSAGYSTFSMEALKN